MRSEETRRGALKFALTNYWQELGVCLEQGVQSKELGLILYRLQQIRASDFHGPGVLNPNKPQIGSKQQQTNTLGHIFLTHLNQAFDQIQLIMRAEFAKFLAKFKDAHS